MSQTAAKPPYARRPAPPNTLKRYLDLEFANIQRGALVQNVRKVFADDEVQASDDTIEVDASSGSITVVLPAPDRLLFLRVTIVRTDSSTHDVLVSGTIPLTSVLSLGVLGQFVTLQSNGVTWLPLNVDLGGFVDVARFGAVGDGVTDDAGAIAAAAAALSAVGGGRLLCPRSYAIKTVLDLSGLRNVEFVGMTGPQGGNGSFLVSSVLSGATAIAFSSTQGMKLSRLSVLSAQTSGTVIGFGWSAANADPAYAVIQECEIAAPLSSTTDLCNIGKLLSSAVQWNQFFGGRASITSGLDYANVIAIEGNTFIDYSGPAIVNPRQNWGIRNNGFEQGVDNTVQALATQDSEFSYGLVYEGNWHGDGVGGTLVSIKTLGATIAANTNFVGAIGVELQDGCAGIEIGGGNRFATTIGIKANATVHGGSIHSNTFAGGTALTGAGNWANVRIFGNDGLADNGVNAPLYAQDPTVGPTIDASGLGNSLANNATMTIPGLLAGSMTVSDSREETVIATMAGGSTVKLGLDTSTGYSTTSGNAGTVNIFFSAGTLTIENKTGSALSFIRPVPTKTF